MRIQLVAEGPLRLLAPGQALRSVLRGAGVAMAIRVVGAALAFGSQVLLARWLGETEYGVFLFAGTCGLLLALPSSLGLTQAALRFVPAYLARGDWSGLAGALRRFRSLVALGGLVGAAVGALAVFVLGERIGGYYLAPLYLALAAVPVYALLNLHGELARGFGWLALAYAPQMVVSPLLLLAGVAALLVLGVRASATTVLATAGAAALLTLLGQAFLLRGRLPRECREAPPVYHTRRWLRVALPLLLGEASIVLLGYTDVLMLGALAGPGEVAVYGAAVKCTSVMTFVFFAMSARAVPRFAELHARAAHDELACLLQSVIRWTFAPSLLLAVALLAFGELLLGLFGPAFVAGHAVLAILVARTMLFAATGPLASLLDVTGNQDASAATYAGGAVANVALNAVLIPTQGIVGAALATALSTLLMTITGVVLVKRRLGILAVIRPVA